MNTFVTDRLFNKFDSQAMKSSHASTEFRTIKDYQLSDKWGSFTSCIISKENTKPSLYNNPFAKDIEHLRKRFLHGKAAANCHLNSVYTTNSKWQTIINDGVTVGNAIYGSRTDEPLGMKCIKQMMQCIEGLVQLENTKLEPFQLEAIKACICSSATRLLGEELNKHIPTILDVTGISDKEGFVANGFVTVEQQNRMLETFNNYARRFVAIIAPRRNGKSKVGKLFVAVNCVCEYGARIVLVAHQLNAVMLYKSDILKHLQTIQDNKLARFKIHTSTNEIRLEFTDRPSSHIYFVAGGINVSIQAKKSIIPSMTMHLLFCKLIFSHSVFCDIDCEFDKIFTFCIACLGLEPKDFKTST